MSGLVGCIVEVGHWDSSKCDEIYAPRWVAEYEARVGAVSQELCFLLVTNLATGDLRRVDINNVKVPVKWRDGLPSRDSLNGETKR